MPSAWANPPVVSHALKADVSPPLKKMHPLPPHAGGGPFEVRRRQNGPSLGPPLLADPVQQMSAPASPAAATLTNWDGVNNIDSSVPPDTNGDVGLSDYVQWVNTSFQIWSKTGTSRYGPAAGNTLWQGFGGLCETTNEGDPIVLYDRQANRWMFSQFAFASKGGNPKAPFYMCLAVSQTGDPTGAYYRYAFQMNNGFPDYPKFGVWPDAYYMSTNNFNGNTFAGAGAYAFDRTKMLTGDPSAAMIAFTLSTSYEGILPSNLTGPTAPPAGSPNYFGSVNTASGSGTGSTFQLWKFHADFATPANSTFTGPTNIAVAPYTFSFCGVVYSSSCIDQPASTMSLDPLADRLMNRFVYRNIGGHETLLATHTVNVGTGGSDRAGMRWYELRSPATTPTLFQQGTFAPSDGVNRWMGSIAMDGGGNIALGYSASDGTSVYPSVRYTGRLTGDPAGTMTLAEQTIIAGGGSQTGYARWGDYSSMSIDPVDDNTFWYTQEYIATTGSAPWRTRIASFTLGTPDTTPPDTVIDTGPSGSTTNASPSFTFHSTESGSTFECKLDGPGSTTGSYGSCTSPKNYTALADGAYTFSVRATDSSSNTDATPATRSFTVDTTPPQTSIDSGPSGTTSASYAQVVFSANDGTATFECNLDGGGWSTCVSPVTLTKLQSGAHTFQVRASDTLGNTDASPASRSWTISPATYRDAVVATPNLLAYWRLGESSGTTAADELFAHDGLYENGTALGIAGPLAGDPNTAAGFDGVDDDVATPALGSTVDFTIEGWQRITDSTNYNNTLFGRGGVMRLLPRPAGYYAGVTLAGTEYTLVGVTASNVATWVHWALVRAGATLTLYRNGVQVATRSDLPSATAASLQGSIGRQSPFYPAKAAIDDVAVYNGALSAATVQAHYLAG